MSKIEPRRPRHAEHQRKTHSSEPRRHGAGDKPGDTHSKVDDRLIIPTDWLGNALRTASLPPQVDAQPIASDKLDTSPLRGCQHAGKLPPHTPSAPGSR